MNYSLKFFHTNFTKNFIVLGLIFNFFSCSLSVPDEVLVEYDKIERKVDFNFDVQPILSDRCYFIFILNLACFLFCCPV